MLSHFTAIIALQYVLKIHCYYSLQLSDNSFTCLLVYSNIVHIECYCLLEYRQNFLYNREYCLSPSARVSEKCTYFSLHCDRHDRWVLKE